MIPVTFRRIFQNFSLVVVLFACHSPDSADQFSQADTAELSSLLLALDDSATHQQAVDSLRSRAAVYLPILEQWMREDSLRRSAQASMAIVLIGSPARAAIRRTLLEDELIFNLRWALIALPSSTQTLELLDPLLTDRDPKVRAEAVYVLNLYHDDAAVCGPALIRALKDPHEKVRHAAASTELSHIQSDSIRGQFVAALRTGLQAPNHSERLAAVQALGKMWPQGKQAIPQILRIAAEDPDTDVRRHSLDALDQLRADPQQTQPVLLTMLHDPADRVRHEALATMGEIGVQGLTQPYAQQIIDTIETRLSHPSASMRQIAAMVLARIGEPALHASIRALQAPETEVVVRAAEGLGEIAHRAEIDRPLLQLLSDNREPVRVTAALALVGAGRRVEPMLRSMARSEPRHRADVASMAAELIRVQQLVDVGNRCYRIIYGQWNPSLPTRSIEGILPPTAVRFRPIVSMRPAESVPAEFLVEQQVRDRWVRSGKWRPDTVAREIVFDAEPQLSGVQFRVGMNNAGQLNGTAETYWDYRREREMVDVRLVDIEC